MDLDRLHELGKSFEAILKLKTKPIGIKFFEKVSDVPDDYEWVERKKVMCNLCGFSRYYELPIAITKENTQGLCPVADISMGIGGVPMDLQKKLRESFQKMLSRLPRYSKA